ncbi:ABC transporter permease [Streptomyces iconiensis]|uniref:ABC transporter permease n=1 Tax=Streptomyces iconiensis TaxID=1384038 RepID=A0ABT7A9P4_9ACTN|nr:ABC transporter permease [Streptomyces iconiensis]MDJ1138076.1 ABC transporter permease [Streptomyces iconiensis]
MLVLVPVLVALALWAFAWPAARTAPRDLPLGVAGPAAATGRAERQLGRNEGAFDLHRYANESAARDAIRDREVYGAVAVTAKGPKLLTASAASPVVAQLLEQASARMAPEGARVPTEDVVAAPEGDPRGAALSASVLPLALAGMAAGALAWLLRLRGTRGVLVLIGSAALVGAVGAGIADSWLGVLSGDWWAEAAAIGLTVLAVASAVAGLGSLLGYRGIGLGALVAILFGNPFSGVSSAPEMLPEPLGLLGQFLPPGAGGTLLRSVSFFDGNGADSPAVVLTVWAVLGLLTVALARGRAGSPHTARPLQEGRGEERTERRGEEPAAEQTGTPQPSAPFRSA